MLTVLWKAHSAKSKQDMTAREYFPAPRPVEELVVKQTKAAIGRAFKTKAKDVQAALDALSSCEEDALRLKVRHSRKIQECHAPCFRQGFPVCAKVESSPLP